MDRLFLNIFDAKLFEILVKHLTQIHNHTFMYLLPQMGTEDLDQRDLEGRNLAVQEDASKVELDLETNVDIGSVDAVIEISTGSIS
jgi:hypothetical protein